MTYEEFKHLAEHPQHRDVPAIIEMSIKSPIPVIPLAIDKSHPCRV